MANTAAADGDVVLVPQRGFLFVDRVGPDSCVATDVRTHESKPLPHGSEAWQVVYDDEGYGVFTSVAGDVLPEAFFQWNLYSTPNDGMVLLDIGEDDEVKERIYMNSVQHAFESKVVTITYGFPERGSLLRVFRLAWSVGGARVFWPISPFYKLLSMTSFGGVVAKWKYLMVKRTLPWLAQMGFGSHIIRANEDRPLSQ